MIWLLLAACADTITPAAAHDTAAPRPAASAAIDCWALPSELQGAIPPELEARGDASVTVELQLLGAGRVCAGGCPTGAAWGVDGAVDPVWWIRVDPTAADGACWIETSAHTFEIEIKKAP